MTAGVLSSVDAHIDTYVEKNADSLWAIVPAAGIGKRMGADIPKQYFRLQGKTILEWSVERLLSVPQITGVIVALHEKDSYWSGLAIAANQKVKTVTGGEERMHSVLNALRFLKRLPDQDKRFVLVHDAVRPCVQPADVQKLITALRYHEVGGLLASPVVDTLKRSDADGNILETIDRRFCWRAQTPQMFKISLLEKSIELLLNRNTLASDESAAIEACGFKPKIIEGQSDNLKLTLADDLPLLDAILQAQLNSLAR